MKSKVKFINQILEDKILSKENFLNILKERDFSQTLKISFVNPFSYGVLINESHIIDSIDYWFSDGQLLCFLTNFRRIKKIDRVSFDFSSIAGDVFEYASKNRLPLALIGATEMEISKAVKYIKSRYPELNICYHRNGYFSIDDLCEIEKNLYDSGAKVVVAGLGTPLQEKFIISLDNMSSEKRFYFTCGGFLSQTGMFGDYYHPIVKKLKLRWLQRALIHKHVRDRLLRDYPKFILSYILDKSFFVD